MCIHIQNWIPARWFDKLENGAHGRDFAVRMGQALSQLNLRHTAGPVVTAEGVAMLSAEGGEEGVAEADTDSDWDDGAWNSESEEEKASLTEIIQSREPFASLLLESMQKYRHRKRVELGIVVGDGLSTSKV